MDARLVISRPWDVEFEDCRRVKDENTGSNSSHTLNLDSVKNYRNHGVYQALCIGGP